MLRVALKGIQINAGHGYYEQEHLLGHQFEVDVEIVASANLDNAFPYLDYSIIYRVVNRHFSQQERLLETLVRSIAKDLKVSFPAIETVRVCVRKMKPPLGGAVHFAEVCYEG